MERAACLNLQAFALVHPRLLHGTRVVGFLYRFAPTGLCPLLGLTFVGLFGLLSFLRLLLLLLLLLLLAHLAGVAALLLLVLFLLLILLGLFLVVALLTTLLLTGVRIVFPNFDLRVSSVG